MSFDRHFTANKQNDSNQENHRFGLPNIYSRNGKIIYEMSGGEIIVKENRQKEKE